MLWKLEVKVICPDGCFLIQRERQVGIWALYYQLNNLSTLLLLPLFQFPQQEIGDETIVSPGVRLKDSLS